MGYTGARFICCVGFAHGKVQSGAGVEPGRDADIRMLDRSAARTVPAKEAGKTGVFRKWDLFGTSREDMNKMYGPRGLRGLAQTWWHGMNSQDLHKSLGIARSTYNPSTMGGKDRRFAETWQLPSSLASSSSRDPFLMKWGGAWQIRTPSVPSSLHSIHDRLCQHKHECVCNIHMNKI